ncbi:MAG: nucleotidyltransferase [Thermodesulfatator sp.]|nr:MAG: nucleotidyltransferase [Thermodesulfatator sp.]
MENFEKRWELALKALESLQEILKRSVDPLTDEYVILRDASIQRFEYTFEIFWKTLKDFLKSYEYIDCFSPNKCFREALKSGLLTPEETEDCLEMLKARNLTVHTYREEIAQQLYPKLEGFANLMERILLRLKENPERRRA